MQESVGVIDVYNIKMELCVLAKIILLLSIIIMSFSVCVFEFSLLKFVFDIFFTILLVLFTNSFCDYWIAHVLVAISLFSALLVITMCSLRDEINNAVIIEEERNKLQMQRQQQK